MHDAAFSEAAISGPSRDSFILGMVLRPYSIGHELCLQKSRNCLVCEDVGPIGGMGSRGGMDPEVAALFEAVLVCSQTWREIERMERDRLIWLKMRIWGWRVRKANIQEGIKAFCRYRLAGYSFPPSKPVGEGGRRPGGPVLARVIQFLVMRMRMTEVEAMDYPLGLAHWHFSTWLEGEGTLNIQNAAEKEFDDFCEAEDAKEARGSGGEPCPV